MGIPTGKAPKKFLTRNRMQINVEQAILFKYITSLQKCRNQAIEEGVHGVSPYKKISFSYTGERSVNKG
jgi:hypothetical protein